MNCPSLILMHWSLTVNVVKHEHITSRPGLTHRPRESDNTPMKTLGNILWLILGGFFSGLGWIIAGLVWCVTIIGIPIGLQCFKLSQLSFLPFGREVSYEGGAGSFIVNIFWFFFGGLELAVCNFIWG